MTDRGPPCSCTLLTNPIPEKRTRQNDSTRAPWHTTGATRQILGTIQDVLVSGEPRQTTVSKWLVTPIYNPFRPFIRGVTPFRGLSNHGYQPLTNWDDDPPSIYPDPNVWGKSPESWEIPI